MLGFKTSSLVLPVPAVATLSEWKKARRLENKIVANFAGTDDRYRLPADQEEDYYSLGEWMNSFNAVNPLAQKPADY